MKLNKILGEQVKALLPANYLAQEDFKLFLNAVNESYDAYERDIALSEHAFKTSEAEYLDLNEKLNDEVQLKEASIKKLKEAILEMGAGAIIESNDENELWHVASQLKKQISELKEKDKKIHDQQEFYERILNVIPADIAIVDRFRKYKFINPHAIKNPELRAWMIGKTEEEYAEFRQKSPESTNKRLMHFEEAVKSQGQVDWEETIVKRDGRTEHQLRMLHPVFDEQGEFDMMVIYGINITERKEIEQQVRISEERYRSIFNNSQALLCTHTLDGIVLDVNPTLIQILGYSVEEFKGTSLYNLFPPEKRTEFESHYIPELREKGKSSGIMIVLDKTGKRIYLLYRNYLVNNGTDEPYVVGTSQDITQRVEAERALKKSERKYRSIIANMNLGLLEVNEKEQIVYANNSFSEMSGYNLEDLIGKKASSIFINEQGIDDSEDVTEMRRLGHSDVYEKKIMKKNGEVRWWLISGAPSYNKAGIFTGSIGIHLDITVQKNLEQALRKAKSDVERSAQSKDIFLANMSHEIRTPMNAILGIERLLSKTPLDDKQRHYLATIQNATNNLLVIINDLLDFSKIEAGKVTIENVGFELKEIIDNAIVILKYKAAEKSIFISNLYSSDIAPVLIGDPYRINQVLMNLLSNSIKFTEHGDITIQCSVLAEDEHSQYVHFKIIDTGIGMSKEFMDLLFDKFAQEDESITRKFGGTGLGMSICKELVELMGGSISVESRKNEGTTISFVLCFARGAEEDLPAKEEFIIDKQIFKGKRILLVEDNEANRLIANTIFSNYGAEVIEAENGHIAIKKYQESEYDIILMDVRMPVKDGLDTTRHIRAHMDTEIPIIALTASALKEEQERCMLAGMNDFISKPFNENKIVQLVAKWLGKEVKITDPQAEEPANSEQLFSLNKLQSIGRGKTEFVKNMVDLFIQNTSHTTQEMQQAFDNNEWKKLAHLAHQIKPSIHNMGIVSLLDDIDILEEIKTDPGDDIGHIQILINHIKTVTTEVIVQLKDVFAGDTVTE